MISVKLAKKKYWENEVEGHIVFLTDTFESAVDISNIEKEYPHVKSILKKHQFKGKVGQSFALTATKNEKLVQFIFIGVGKWDRLWYQELEDLRRSVGAAVLLLKKLEVESAVIQIPDNKVFGVEQPEVAKQMAIAAIMASYEFTTFKCEKKEKAWKCDLFFASSGAASEQLALAIEEAKTIGEAINQSRLICDMPPNIATPMYVAAHAKKISTDIMGLQCAVFGRNKAEELGMGGFLAVDAGSDQEGQFVVLEYLSEKKDVPTIALVGKGVTFDSGGISLKPAASMTGMKFDMSGAAAVIAAMKIIALLKPDVHVVGITPLVENMPSGQASKQDDIITFMNGKTAEIVNTDAEGRLILADALCYAEEFYKPDVIIDVATLTGACLYALGYSFTALMTKDQKLASVLESSGELTGDRVWQLPLADDFKPAIKSKVADISNTGSTRYKAFTITAGWFLSHFVKKTPWAHLDIAGTADSVPDVNYLGNGAGSTGAGIRLLVDFVMKYKK